MRKYFTLSENLTIDGSNPGYSISAPLGIVDIDKIQHPLSGTVENPITIIVRNFATGIDGTTLTKVDLEFRSLVNGAEYKQLRSFETDVTDEQRSQSIGAIDMSLIPVDLQGDPLNMYMLTIPLFIVELANAVPHFEPENDPL